MYVTYQLLFSQLYACAKVIQEVLNHFCVAPLDSQGCSVDTILSNSRSKTM